MSLETNSFEFGEFLLDRKEKVLLHRGKPLSITPKAFQLLQILVENHGHLVERDELLNTIWRDSFVEEGNLNFTIRLLRKALGDNKQKPSFIETVQTRGYRFIAEVSHPISAPRTGKQNSLPKPVQKPYFLIIISIIALISILSIALVWYNSGGSLAARPKFTRLTTGGKVTLATVSPDGEFIIFAQKEGVGESLWRRSLKTNNQQQILPPQEVEFVGLTVSPDNRYAYFSVFSKNSAILTLTRLSLQSNLPESLSEIDTDASVSFSPDGKKFAFTESFSSLKETQLKIADADGLNQQVLVKAKDVNRKFPIYQASPVAWSPDGKTIACAVQVFEANGSFYRVLLVNPNDGSEKYLSEKHWDLIENIAWKDAENLAVINQEPNSSINQIWLVSRQTGEPRQITRDSNAYQWLSSSNGNLVAVQKSIFSSLHIADLAEDNKTIQSKQILGESGVIENVRWSLDGRLFYNSQMSGKNEIWLVNSDGTTPQQLTTDSNLTLSFAVSPIDNSLVFSTLQNGKISLSTIDSKGQNFRPLTDGSQDISPTFSPDGKMIFFQRSTNQTTLWQLSADGNSPPVQLTGYLAASPAVSPDGQEIAYHFMDYGGNNPHWKLGLINLENHRLLNKLDFPLPITERKTLWRPQTDLLTMIFYNGENAGILLISPRDGKFQTLENMGSGKITSFDWSADGNRIAFSKSFATNDVVSITTF
jgi:DNA-binding winged helix-turn-helix (wHTH) protein/Tol biopolymer transport system component